MADRDDLTNPTALAFRDSLAQDLIEVADTVRDLNTEFGLRPYIIHIIRTRWSGESRGDGVETLVSDLVLLPVPKAVTLDGLTEILNPGGLDENGSVLVKLISGAYTEEQLRGLDPYGNPPDPTEQVFYEIQFLRPDGLPGDRRHFVLRGAPTYYPDRFSWEVRLEKTISNRLRNGDPGP